MYLSVYLSLSVHELISVNVRECIPTSICTCTHLCKCTWVRTYLYLYMYAPLYVYWPLNMCSLLSVCVLSSIRGCSPVPGGAVAVASSSFARILWECLTIHSPPVHCCFLCVFFKVEISSRTLIPLFTPRSVHSGSASWDDCGWLFADELYVSLFPDRFPHHAWTAA